MGSFPPMATPDVTPEQARQIGDALAENGRVLATLDDWRAILFVAAGLIIIQVVVIVVLLRSNRQERKDMSDERARMWAVADKFGEAANKLVAELQVQAALSSRVESALARCEEIHNANRPQRRT